jgi:predicted transcriptional regulator
MAQTLRLPEDVKEALRETAAREGRSEHDVIVTAVQRYTADRNGRRDALIDTVLERDARLLERLAQ